MPELSAGKASDARPETKRVSAEVFSLQETRIEIDCAEVSILKTSARSDAPSCPKCRQAKRQTHGPKPSGSVQKFPALRNFRVYIILDGLHETSALLPTWEEELTWRSLGDEVYLANIHGQCQRTVQKPMSNVRVSSSA